MRFRNMGEKEWETERKRYLFNHIPGVVLCRFVCYVYGMFAISYPFSLSLVVVVLFSWQNYIMAMLDIGYLLIFISHRMHLSILNTKSMINMCGIRFYTFLSIHFFSICFMFTFFFCTMRKRIILDYIWYDIVAVSFFLVLWQWMWLCMFLFDIDQSFVFFFCCHDRLELKMIFSIFPGFTVQFSIQCYFLCAFRFHSFAFQRTIAKCICCGKMVQIVLRLWYTIVERLVFCYRIMDKA